MQYGMRLTHALLLAEEFVRGAGNRLRTRPGTRNVRYHDRAVGKGTRYGGSGTFFTTHTFFCFSSSERRDLLTQNRVLGGMFSFNFLCIVFFTVSVAHGSAHRVALFIFFKIGVRVIFFLLFFHTHT